MATETSKKRALPSFLGSKAKAPGKAPPEKRARPEKKAKAQGKAPPEKKARSRASQTVFVDSGRFKDDRVDVTSVIESDRPLGRYAPPCLAPVPVSWEDTGAAGGGGGGVEACYSPEGKSDLVLQEEQKRAVRYLMQTPSSRGVILAHPTGTGKTDIPPATIACVFREWAAMREVDPACRRPPLNILVLTPKPLKLNFWAALTRWGLTPARFQTENVTIRVMNFEEFEPKYSRGLINCANTFLIVDEAHRLATPISPILFATAALRPAGAATGGADGEEDDEGRRADDRVPNDESSFSARTDRSDRPAGNRDEDHGDRGGGGGGGGGSGGGGGGAAAAGGRRPSARTTQKPQGRRAAAVIKCAAERGWEANVKPFYKAILMTATPMVNDPGDLVNLLSVLDGVIPTTGQRMVFTRLYKQAFNDAEPRGVRKAALMRLRELVQCKMSYFVCAPGTEKFPERQDFLVDIPMPPVFYQAYRDQELELRSKARGGDPTTAAPKKRDAFLNQLRQATTGLGGIYNPKVQWLTNRLRPVKGVIRPKTYVYSPWIGHGVDQLVDSFEKAGIEVITLTGEDEDEKTRAAKVNRFNAIRPNEDTPVFVASAAGGTGLDFQGLEQIFITAPAWNMATVDQVAGRGRRRGSPVKLVNVYFMRLVPPQEAVDAAREARTRIPQSVDQRTWDIATEKQLDIDRFTRDVIVPTSLQQNWRKCLARDEPLPTVSDILGTGNEEPEKKKRRGGRRGAAFPVTEADVSDKLWQRASLPSLTPYPTIPPPPPGWETQPLILGDDDESTVDAAAPAAPAFLPGPALLLPGQAAHLYEVMRRYLRDGT